jgi:hypothetical protein
MDDGTYRAPRRDATIVATAAGARAQFALLVGRRDVALPFFDAAHDDAWHFASAPAGAPGAVALHADGPSLELAYDFTSGERAAYADTDLALPGEPLVFSIDVRGDGSGVELRAAFVNKFGERRALPLSGPIDWSGWRMTRIAIPDDLNPPVRLVALYVLDPAAKPVHAMGTIAFRAATATVAGTP